MVDGRLSRGGGDDVSGDGGGVGIVHTYRDMRHQDTAVTPMPTTLMRGDDNVQDVHD